MIEISPTALQQVALLGAVEKSAGQAFLAVPEFAWIAEDAVMSRAEHARFVGLGTSWVAVEDDQIMGFVCAEVFGVDLHVWELAVHADAQRRGIGASLMQQVLVEAVRCAAKFVTLTTFREVAFNAPLYQKLGFEIIAADTAGAGAGAKGRLRQVLDGEAAHGFPAESRCAMRFLV